VVVLPACISRLAASGAEAWLALSSWGRSLGIVPALAPGSLLYAIRRAAFIVPNASACRKAPTSCRRELRAHADFALGLSLLKRGRDLLLGVPRCWRGRSSRATACGSADPSRDRPSDRPAD